MPSYANTPVICPANGLCGISHKGGAVSPAVARVIKRLAVDVAKNYGLSAEQSGYFLAIIEKESGFNPSAANGSTSATGLWGITDGTRVDFKLPNNLMWDAEAQLEAAAQVFIYCWDKTMRLNQPMEWVNVYYKEGRFTTYERNPKGVTDAIYEYRQKVLPNREKYEGYFNSFPKQLSGLTDSYFQEYAATGKLPPEITLSQSDKYITLIVNPDVSNNLKTDNPQLAQENRIFLGGSLVLAKEGERIRMTDGKDYIAVSSQEKQEIEARFGLKGDNSPNNLVAATDYDDNLRAKLTASYAFWGQGFGQQQALSYGGNMLANLGDIYSGMQNSGFGDALIADVMPDAWRGNVVSSQSSGSDVFPYSWGQTYAYNDNASDDFDTQAAATGATAVTGGFTGLLSSIDSAVASLFSPQRIDVGGTTLTLGLGPSGSGGSGGSSGANLGGCSIEFPVAIDLGNTTNALTKDAIDLKSMFTSTAFFDMDGDGFRERTGWVGPNDGMLVIDLGGDSIIDKADEISFKRWSPDATTDLDGLRIAFDSNHDGVFNAQDARFSEFRIWQDSNQDGVSDPGELFSFESQGVAAPQGLVPAAAAAL